MDDCILHTMNKETLDYSTEAWVGEAISNGMRRHTKCFNCGIIGHLRSDCRQGIPRNNVSSGNGENRRTQPSGICKRCGKGQYWTNECRSTNDRQGNPIPLGYSLGEPLVGPHYKHGPIIPSCCGECVSPRKFKNPVPTVKKIILVWMME